MTRTELINLLADNFYEDFAASTSALVVDCDCVGLIYDLAVQREPLPKSLQDKVTFRAAYVLETIYFNYPDKFTDNMRRRFCFDFPTTTNESAKRHFTKMMKDLLRRHPLPAPAQCDAIAEACAMWVTESKAKIAVRIGAIEVMLCLRESVTWIAEILPELFESLRRHSTPGMQVRLKRWSALVD